jgi:hypothetical protein
MKKTLLILFTLLSVLGFGASVNTVTTKGAFYQWASSTGSAVNAADVLQQIATNTSYIGQGYLGALSLTGSALILNAGVGVTGVITSLGNISTLSTTQSISVTTGALIVDGGVGIAKDLRIGGIIVSGNHTIYDLDSTINDTESLIISSNAQDVSGSKTASDGIIFKGAANVTSASIKFHHNQGYGNSADLSLSTTDGVGVNTERIRIDNNGKVNIKANTASTTTTTGALVVDGGTGIAGNLNIGGTIFSRNTNGWATTTCSATVTTLTSISNRYQFFTGTTTQSVLLPVTSTLSTGQMWEIKNNTTNAVITVNSSGSDLVQTVTPGMKGKFTCIGTTSTDAIDWDSEVNGVNLVTGSEIATNEYIDGNRVYCKIINFGALPNNTTKNVAHGIANLDLSKVTFFYGACQNGSSVNSAQALSDSFNLTTTNIVSITGSNRSTYTTTLVTIKYSK